MTPGAATPSAPPRPWTLAAVGAVVALLALAAIAITIVFQLSPYVGRTSPGLSFDTPYYVWRTNLVTTEGTEALTSFPEATRTNPERVGFPVSGATLGAVTGIDGLSFAILVRAFAAAAIGLAAAGAAIAALGHPAWAAPLFVVGLGTSAAITGTAIGSLENLLADAPLMLLAGVVPLVLTGRGGWWSIPILFAGAALVHWVFAILLASVLLATGVFSAIPWLRPTGSSGRRQLLRAAALAGLLLVGLGVAAVLVPAFPEQLPPVVVKRFGNEHRVPLYELPILLPLAAMGLALSLRRSTPTSRASAVLFGLWAASVPVAIALSALTPLPLKVFRVAPFALGVPVLVVAGLVALTRLGTERLRVVGAALGVAVAAVALTAALPPQVGPFNDRNADVITRRIEQGRVIADYVGGQDPARGLVVVVGAGAPTFDRTIRASVPAAWLRTTHIYLGDPEDLFAGRPMDDPRRPERSLASQEWWAEAWPDPELVLSRDPVVVGINLRPRQVEGAPTLAAGIAVLRGPAPDRPVGETPVRIDWDTALGLCALLLGVAAVAGIGWTIAVLDVPWLAALLLAPGAGVALLVVGGTLAGRLGATPGGGVGIGLVVGIAVSGAAAAWLRVRRRRPEPVGAPG